MLKHPHTDLIDVPALHWHNVYDDLLGIEDMDATMDDYNDGDIVTAYVECFTRADGYYHWQVHKREETSHGWMETREEAQADCEKQFDLVRNT